MLSLVTFLLILLFLPQVLKLIVFMLYNVLILVSQILIYGAVPALLVCSVYLKVKGT
jgi:hypothetical protein